MTVSDMNPLEFNGIEQTTAVDVIMTDRGCVAKSSGMVYFKRGRGYKGGKQDGFAITATGSFFTFNSTVSE